MRVKLSDFTKLVLDVETTSLTEYSAPDSLHSLTATRSVDSSHHHGRPNKIKYDYLDLRIRPRHGTEELPLEPSYTGRKPYSIVCAVRRLRNLRKYNQQFEHEVNQLALSQTTAYENAIFFRLMSYTSLWPPLHTYKEAVYTSRHLFPRSQKHKRRLQYLLTTDFI